jgi:predicted transposase YbfD/YdcC
MRKPRRLFPPRQQRLWAATFDEVTTCAKGHGRLEKRTLRATTALVGYLDWPDVAQVGRVEAEVTRDGQTTREVRYFITSVPRAVADARRLLTWVRGHWSIENRTHYVRDVTLGEDASRVRQGSGPQVLAAVRNAAVALLRQWGGFGSIPEALRRNAARVPELFAKLGIL